MAQLRLIAIPLVLCTASEAAPSKLAAPKGWLVDEKLSASAASAAAGEKIEVLGSDAWSDASRGCFAIFLDLRGGATTTDDVVAAIANEKIQTREVLAKPDSLTLTFERAPYHGKLAAKIAAGEIRALACMWNQREPKACEAGCATLLGEL
jgi:hypothetical protein